MDNRQSRNKKEIIGDPINRKEDRLVVLSRRQESMAAAAINRRCPLALIEEHGSSSLGSILARRSFAHPRHPEEVLVTSMFLKFFGEFKLSGYSAILVTLPYNL